DAARPRQDAVAPAALHCRAVDHHPGLVDRDAVEDAPRHDAVVDLHHGPPAAGGAVDDDAERVLVQRHAVEHHPRGTRSRRLDEDAAAAAVVVQAVLADHAVGHVEPARAAGPESETY